MPIPIEYRRVGEGSISSYDFTDIANATGIINFYGGDNVSSAYIISNVAFYSDDIGTTGSTTSDTYQLVMDLDFDAVMNTPATFRGKALVNLSFGLWSTDATNVLGFVRARIRKYSGTTETEIVATQGDIITVAGGGTVEFHTTALGMDFPLTSFKKGDTLRLTIEGWLKDATNGNTARMVIAHDPRGRTTYTFVTKTWDANYPTTLNFLCPRRIDL